MPTELAFICNGESVTMPIEDGETLLSVLRERLGTMSVKDGCAPQGQCGCCTVFVDGAPRVSCVTPAARVAGRAVTTIEGIDPMRLAPIVDEFVAHGASQCGFCTPGIVLRCLALVEGERPPTRIEADRALAAHLCRCTGWNTIFDAIDCASRGEKTMSTRDQNGAALQATIEGRTAQAVGAHVVHGYGGFADDSAPRDALVAVPKPPDSVAVSVVAASMEWVVGRSLFEARAAAGKIQGRRTTVTASPPFASPDVPAGQRGVRLATSWNEPGYLEPDASWCVPGGNATPSLGNGGAFGGKTSSLAAIAARELADKYDAPVRVVFSREDVVRLGPKRPPIAAAAWVEDDHVCIDGRGPLEPVVAASPYVLATKLTWATESNGRGPIASHSLRAPWAEVAVLIEGAIDASGIDRRAILDEHGRAVALDLDVCVRSPEDTYVGARCELAPDGAIRAVTLRIACGVRHDDVVARSYCVGAAHMAIGWVLSEGLAVDPTTGEIHDLTIRSFGIVRPKHMPMIEIVFLEDPREARNSSDAVFAATAAALWSALARLDGVRPAQFPALDTRTSRLIRR